MFKGFGPFWSLTFILKAWNQKHNIFNAKIQRFKKNYLFLGLSWYFDPFEVQNVGILIFGVCDHYDDMGTSLKHYFTLTLLFSLVYNNFEVFISKI